MLELTDCVDGDEALDGWRGRELDEGKEDDLHGGLRHQRSEHTLFGGNRDLVKWFIYFGK